MSPDTIKLLKEKVFDKSKWMQLPRDVVIGHDVLGQITPVCTDLKMGKSALLISGKNTMETGRENRPGPTLQTGDCRDLLRRRDQPGDYQGC